MKVVIYVRVSTDMQSDEGYSLDAQIDRCKAYCISQGWEVVFIYVEEGESAKDMNRPELQRLLSDAQTGLFDVVLVYKLDRLTRSVRDLHVLLDTFEKHNIKFRSATEVYDTTTAMGKLFITIVAALAEWERGNLAERVRFGMEQLVREGKWHGGPVPFGYEWDGTTMSIVPEELTVLRELRRVYMSGEGFGGTAKSLNTRGLLRRNGQKWLAQGIYYILDNPFYAGKLRYGSKKKNGKYAGYKKSENVDVIWSDTGFPTIFTWEEYEEHMARMKRRQYYGTSRKRDYWFSGVVRCARCGNTMQGRPYRNPRKDGSIAEGIVNYICSNKSQQGGCDMPLLRQSLLEGLVMEHIRNIKFTQEDLIAAGAEMDKIQTDFSLEMEQLVKEQKAIAERRRKWQYMFAEDLMSEDDFRLRKREEDEKEQIILERIDEIKHHELGMNTGMMDIIFDLPEYWGALSDQDKRDTMQTIFESIYVECEVKSGKGVSAKGKSLPFYIKDVNFN